ncbi:hypothetical protein B0H13DRAFT_2682283 [Mycena leptocephala]|nr:hypothetical protein B0H13DRAFT_2682283 [Mycena leptocephala]
MASTATLLAQATDSLADPNNPTFCCRYYICLLSQIEDLHGNFWENPIIPDASYASDSLRLKLAPSRIPCPCSTFYQFSSPQIGLVRTWPPSLSGWNAANAIWDFNAYCWDPPGFATRSCTLEGLIGIVAHIFSDALELRRRRRTGWPKNRQCLAGTGEAAATMLCRWLDFYPILPLLRAISEAASVFGQPVLIPFLLSTHLPKNLVAILKRGVDSLPVDFAGEATPFGIVYPITLVFDTFRRLLNIDDGVSPAYFYREHCPLLLETLTRVAEIEKKMTWIFDGGWEFGLNLGGVVHSQLVLPFDEAKYHSRILAYSKKHRSAILHIQTPYQLAMNIMLTLAEMPPQCMNVSCTKATPASICSGCKRVAYCDAQCQTRDWNGQLPHKKVCKTIRALADAAGFPVYAIPKYLPELDANARRRVEDAVSLAAVNSFNKNMMEDDRIRKVINDILVISARWIKQDAIAPEIPAGERYTIDDTPSLFRNITHLELLGLLALIPALTHVAFNLAPLPETFYTTLRADTRLQCIVFLSLDTDEIENTYPLAGDARFLCIYQGTPYCVDWLRGAYTNDDYWAVADSFIAARRMGKVNPTEKVSDSVPVPERAAVNGRAEARRRTQTSPPQR